MKKWFLMAAGLLLMAALLVSCDEGANDWNSSATISGWVYADPSHTRGIEGVQVIFESDPNADNPYAGPDRWVTTNGNGHFEGGVFLGNQNGDYNYIADLSVGYFWHNKSFSWSGGITVGPGSSFTLPPVDTTMFQPLVGGGQ